MTNFGQLYLDLVLTVLMTAVTQGRRGLVSLSGGETPHGEADHLSLPRLACNC